MDDAGFESQQSQCNFLYPKISRPAPGATAPYLHVLSLVCPQGMRRTGTFRKDRGHSKWDVTPVQWFLNGGTRTTGANTDVRLVVHKEM
jgi:hypothetical protein